jgi:hypothetical protein
LQVFVCGFSVLPLQGVLMEVESPQGDALD